MALLNSGMTLEDEPVQKALKYLRTQVREPEPDWTYEIALMAMALEAAHEGQRDYPTIRKLAAKLEASQTLKGDHRGSWGYTVSGKDRGGWEGDRSNAQYAILGLHAAAEAGVPIKRSTWERARQHWLDSQGPDGGWNYAGPPGFNNTGSMTAAGIASLVITESHLRDPSQEETPDGEPLCCRMPPDNQPLEKALAWMGKHYSPGNNFGNNGKRVLYYTYGVERAGRLERPPVFRQPRLVPRRGQVSPEYATSRPVARCLGRSGGLSKGSLSSAPALRCCFYPRGSRPCWCKS